MIHLNNKGMTSIEVLISFIIVSSITITLFDLVTSYKTKQQVESYKSKINEYKSSITKVINDDIVKYGLAGISSMNQTNDTEKSTYKITLYFEKNTINKNNNCSSNYAANGCHKTLQVVKYSDSSTTINSKVDYIIYPEVAAGSLRNITYYLPDIGGAADADSGNIVKDIRFSSVSFRNVIDNAVLDVGIFHHELSTYYHIHIVAPVNYYRLNDDSVFSFRA